MIESRPIGTVMSRSSGLTQLLKVDVKVESVEADGDCFYACVAKALSSKPELLQNRHGHDWTIHELRQCVADAVTLEVLERFQTAAIAGLEGYSWVHQCPDLAAAQARIAQSASESSARQRVVWADDFAIHTISKSLALGVLIVNDAATRARRRQSSTAGSKFLKVLPEEGDVQHYIVIRKSRREHYDLLRINGVTLLELPLSEKMKAPWKL
eukprot:m.130513 g.130513  ORF g.130513 m.130513 type:complete len:212 (-) comp15876_c0_seq2:2415-3050(-)